MVIFAGSFPRLADENFALDFFFSLLLVVVVLFPFVIVSLKGARKRPQHKNASERARRADSRAQRPGPTGKTSKPKRPVNSNRLKKGLYLFFFFFVSGTHPPSLMVVVEKTTKTTVSIVRMACSSRGVWSLGAWWL